MSIVYEFGNYRLDPAERRLTRSGDVVRLEPKSFDLLCVIVENAGRLVTKDQLVAEVWGLAVVTDNSITRCIHQVRAALKDSADDPQFIETVAGSGYRFVADVTTIDAAPAPTDSAAPGSRSNLPLLAAAISVFAVAIIWIAYEFAPAPDEGIERIAVLPLANLTGDPDQQYFVQGIHEGLIAALSGLQGVDVISRTSVMRFSDGAISIPEIARQLGVDALVEGSVARTAEELTVTVQLIDADPERGLWSNRYHREVSDVFEITTEVAKSVAAEIAAVISPAVAGGAPIKVNPAAYDAYLLGTFHLAQRTREGYGKAREAFRRVIEIDPEFAPGFLGLADTVASPAVFGLRRPADAFPRSRELAETAIRLDSTLSDAHLTLAAVDFYWGWDWAAAEDGMKRALALNPNSAYSHRFVSEVYSVTGRHDEAVQSIERGRELDPFQPISQIKPSLILYLKGDYEAAIESATGGLEFFPGFWQGHWLICLSFSALDRSADGVGFCQRAAELSPDAAVALAALAYVYAQERRYDEAESILTGMIDAASRQYVSPASIAIVHSALGDLDEAVRMLGVAFDERDQMLVHIDNYRLFDILRDDPRFPAHRARLTPL